MRGGTDRHNPRNLKALLRLPDGTQSSAKVHYRYTTTKIFETDIFSVTSKLALSTVQHGKKIPQFLAQPILNPNSQNQKAK